MQGIYNYKGFGHFCFFGNLPLVHPLPLSLSGEKKKKIFFASREVQSRLRSPGTGIRNRRFPLRFASLQLDSVWLGSVRLGSVRFGSVLFGWESKGNPHRNPDGFQKLPAIFQMLRPHNTQQKTVGFVPDGFLITFFPEQRSPEYRYRFPECSLPVQ